MTSYRRCGPAQPAAITLVLHDRAALLCDIA